MDFGVSLEAQSEKVRTMAVVQGAELVEVIIDAGRIREVPERVGTVPFGYRVGANGFHLEADPAEQGILSRIRELKGAGYTTRQIADELNRQGFTTRRGTAWRFQYVAEGLRAA